jgi:hypothetical protein
VHFWNTAGIIALMRVRSSMRFFLAMLLSLSAISLRAERTGEHRRITDLRMADACDNPEYCFTACEQGDGAACTTLSWAYDRLYQSQDQAAEFALKGCQAGDENGCRFAEWGLLFSDHDQRHRGRKIMEQTCRDDVMDACLILYRVELQNEAGSGSHDAPMLLQSDPRMIKAIRQVGQRCQAGIAGSCLLLSELSSSDAKTVKKLLPWATFEFLGKEIFRLNARDCDAGNAVACIRAIDYGRRVKPFIELDWDRLIRPDPDNPQQFHGCQIPPPDLKDPKSQLLAKARAILKVQCEDDHDWIACRNAEAIAPDPQIYDAREILTTGFDDSAWIDAVKRRNCDQPESSVCKRFVRQMDEMNIPYEKRHYNGPSHADPNYTIPQNKCPKLSSYQGERFFRVFPFQGDADAFGDLINILITP